MPRNTITTRVLMLAMLFAFALPPHPTAKAQQAHAAPASPANQAVETEPKPAPAEAAPIAPIAPATQAGSEPRPIAPVAAPSATTNAAQGAGATAASSTAAPEAQAPAMEPSLGEGIGAPGATATAAPATSPHSQDAIESEPGKSDKQPSVPWTASLGWTQAFYAKGVGVTSYQSYNPEYYWGFLLTAGYKFTDATAVTFNEYMTVELTDSDTTVGRQQLAFFNPTVDLSHKLKFETAPKQQLSLTGAVGALFPTSTSTQASTFLVGTNTFGARARIGATYTWKSVFQGLELSPGFGYQRRFNTSNTLSSASSFPCALTGGASSQNCSYLGSPTTTRDVFIVGLDTTADLSEKFVGILSLSFYWTRGRDLATVNYTPESGGVYTLPDDSTTHWRNLRWLSFSLGYKFTKWLMLAGRVSNIFSERGPRNELRSPFIPLDTLFALDLDVSFDALYLSTQNHGAAAH